MVSVLHQYLLMSSAVWQPVANKINIMEERDFYQHSEQQCNRDASSVEADYHGIHHGHGDGAGDRKEIKYRTRTKSIQTFVNQCLAPGTVFVAF